MNSKTRLALLIEIRQLLLLPDMRTFNQKLL